MADSSASRFGVGAIGRPGERVFLLELEVDSRTRWFHLEKMQVAALAEQSLQLLKETGFEGAGLGIDADLTDPDEIDFRVTEVRLLYREETGLIEVTLSSGNDDEVEEVQFTVTPAQLDALARQGEEAVGAGRPICPKCGLAMDPDGHPCPTGNGDLRGHRP